MSKKSLKPLLSAFIAMDENRAIGAQNRLPWHLPADMRHFKNITSGHVIIMGRKTYESIGKPLPNRCNIILTRDQAFQAPGCLVVTNVHEALKVAKQHAIANGHQSALPTTQMRPEVFVIGGAEVYRLLLPYCERIYLTLIHHQFTGDSFFPALPEHDWQEVKRIDCAADAENHYNYSFIWLERKQHASTQ